jgi:hypothetical protein
MYYSTVDVFTKLILWDSMDDGLRKPALFIDNVHEHLRVE